MSLFIQITLQEESKHFVSLLANVFLYDAMAL